jgi:hypothetical protein
MNADECHTPKWRSGLHSFATQPTLKTGYQCYYTYVQYMGRTIDVCGGIADVSNPCNRKALYLDAAGITAASAVPDVCRRLGTGARRGPVYALRLQFLHRLRTGRGMRSVGMR